MRLSYQGGNHVYLFKCHWFDSAGSGVRVDKNRVVTIDMKSRLRSNEVFILASQATQVYYAPSILNPRSNLRTVIPIKNQPLDESTKGSDMEDAFQEIVSNASTSSSFSLFIDFSQYEPIPSIQFQDEDDKEDDNENDNDNDNEDDFIEELDEDDQENEDMSETDDDECYENIE